MMNTSIYRPFGYWSYSKGGFFLEWREAMPRIPEPYLNCVFYIYPSHESAERGDALGATGFFAGVPIDGVPNAHWIYAITNKHVVNKTPTPVLRINNKRGGFNTTQTNAQDWDVAINDDVAVIRMGLNIEADLQYTWIPISIFITPQITSERKIGFGDLAIMAGRFIEHEGKKQNLPAARFGEISQNSNPEESIYIPELGIYQECFLVEAHSIPGYSGSPVYWWIEPLSVRPGSTVMEMMQYQGLLGIECANIARTEPVRDEHGNIVPEWRVNINTGMSVIVPAWKILELINMPKQQQQRQNGEKDLKERIAKSGVKTTAASDNQEEHVLTKEEFEEALKKISRPLKPDDQEKKGT